MGIHGPCMRGDLLGACRTVPLTLPALHVALLPPPPKQVAMLFLVKGPLRHEAMWRAWFERAQGLLPAQAVSNSLCASEDGMPAALAACSSLANPPSQAGALPGAHSGGSGGNRRQPAAPPGPSSSSRSSSSSSSTASSLRRWLYERWHPGGTSPAPGVLDRQHLFDVYVHPHPNFTGGPRSAAVGA